MSHLSKKKPFILSILLIAATLLLAACSGSASSASQAPQATKETAAPPAPATAETAAEAGGATDSVTAPQVQNRKMVLTVNIDLETTDFTAAVQDIENATAKSGGYLSSTQIYSQEERKQHSGSFTAMVPPEAYADFLAAIQESSNITSRSEQTQDITQQYTDVEARLNSLRKQEKRLLEMMESADKLADIIAIQNQITEVQYQIESFTSTQRGLDHQISYNTVYIQLQEVQELTEVVQNDYSSRAAKAFANSWRAASAILRDIGIILIWLLPFILFIGVPLFILLFVLNKRQKKRMQQGGQPYFPPIPPAPHPPQDPQDPTKPV